jgi:hypothetical protein
MTDTATTTPTGRPRRRYVRKGATIAADGAGGDPTEDRGQRRVATSAAPATVPIGGDDAPDRLTRRSRVNRGSDDFDVPEDCKKPGWDYEWKSLTVMGQPVDGADMAKIYGQGWRPVAASEMPDLVPPGWDKKTIERYGQILMTRPMHLTQAARREDRQIADEQLADKLRGAVASAGGKIGTPRLETMEITGHVGVAKQRGDE